MCSHYSSEEGKRCINFKTKSLAYNCHCCFSFPKIGERVLHGQWSHYHYQINCRSLQHSIQHLLLFCVCTSSGQFPTQQPKSFGSFRLLAKWGAREELLTSRMGHGPCPFLVVRRVVNLTLSSSWRFRRGRWIAFMPSFYGHFRTVLQKEWELMPLKTYVTSTAGISTWNAVNIGHW